MAEVQLAKLAEKSGNPQVRRFAERMVVDHRKANRQLSSIAMRSGIPMPTAPNAEHQHIRQQLASSHDSSFSRRYAQAMVEDHEQAVKLFQQEAATAQNPALKKFAEETLATLKDHFRLATDLSTRLADTAAK